jgi:hypothetical protein
VSHTYCASQKCICNVIPVRALKAYRGSRSTAQFILNLCTRCWCGQLRIPTDLPPGNNHGAHCIGGCAGCNDGQVVLIHAQVRTVGRPVRSLAKIPTTLSRHLIFTHCVLLNQLIRFKPRKKRNPRPARSVRNTDKIRIRYIKSYTVVSSRKIDTFIKNVTSFVSCMHVAMRTVLYFNSWLNNGTWCATKVWRTCNKRQKTETFRLFTITAEKTRRTEGRGSGGCRRVC